MNCQCCQWKAVERCVCGGYWCWHVYWHPHPMIRTNNVPLASYPTSECEAFRPRDPRIIVAELAKIEIGLR